jgi:hypothetical protein
MEQLPAELLAGGVLRRLDSRSLGRVACTSRAIHRLASADEAWRPLLLAQGVTAAGLALWKRQRRPTHEQQQVAPVAEEEAAAGEDGPGESSASLMQLFAFADRYHEALEFEVLSHRPSRRGSGGHWNACLEFANPWPVPVWTFFATRSWPRHGGSASPVEESVQLASESGSCCAEGFAAMSDVGRGEVILLHLLPLSTGAERDFGFSASTAYAIPRHPDHIYGCCLPAGAHAERLVSIGEHAGLGYSEEDEEADCFPLDVVQAVNVRINGVPVESSCPYDLASSGGAIVPTTRPTSTVDIGADFDWERRARTPEPQAEPEPQPETAVGADTVEPEKATPASDAGTAPAAGQWDLDDDLAHVVTFKGAQMLTYDVIRRSVAYRSIP